MQGTGLVLETSTERGVFAVFDCSVCLFQEELPFGIQNSHLLLPALQKKMKGNALVFQDLSFIVVGIGPGSYTGIRVGATIAKILAFTFQIPLIGVCTLDAFIPENEGIFAALIDAKIGGVYLQTGYLKNGVVESILKPGAYSLQEANELLQDIPRIITPNAEKIRSKLESLSQKKWEWQEKYPQPEQLLYAAKSRMPSGVICDDQHLELLYMRKTQAEIEKDMFK